METSMERDLKVFFTQCLKLCLVSVACLPVIAFAAVYMGTSAVPTESQVTSVQKNLTPPFGETRSVTTASVVRQEVIQENCEPYTGKGPMPPNACAAPVDPRYTTANVGKPIVVQVNEGSLKSNIERIMKEAGWEVTIWKVPFDYKWIGNVTITANDVQGIITKLIEPYPLQAVFYNANHVVAISPRRNT